MNGKIYFTWQILWSQFNLRDLNPFVANINCKCLFKWKKNKNLFKYIYLKHLNW